MYQVYYWIEDDTKGTDEFETLVLAQSRFDSLIQAAEEGYSYYFSIVDSEGTTVQEARR